MNLKKKFTIFASAIILLGSITPVFSVSAETIASQTVNTFSVKLNEASSEVFNNDPNIFSAENIFINPVSASFRYVYEVKTDYSLVEFKNKYSSNIVYAETEHQVKVGDTEVVPVTVNDPGFTASASDINRTWGLPKAQFTQAWSKTTGNVAVTVAIIDTGIDDNHEDLSAGQVIAGFDFLTRADIPTGTDSDDNSHGTMVAGVIGATPNNFRGIAGTNWNVSLMPLKALDAKGSGNSADVAAAIVYAADHGANIINMSLGGVGFGNDTTLSAAITYAFNKGLVLVAAAGNDVATTGGNLDNAPVFPVCSDNGNNMIIGVAASDYNDQKADFSNYGKACVDVIAPGRRILTTINIDPNTRVAQSNGYAYASGTSLATPFVSGEAALIKAFYPQADNKEIRERIIKSTDNIDASNPTQCNNAPCLGLIGTGRINAFKALDPSSAPQVILQDGDLVEGTGSPQIYLIVGSQKQPVSTFVFNQRFIGQPLKLVPQNLLDPLPVAHFALPNDGTLIKSASSPTVFEIVSGIKQPITYQIFLQRKYVFAQVNNVTDEEINSWLTGTFLPPVEGTLVRAKVNPTIYWTIGGLLHPMNAKFYLDRGLNKFPVMIISDNDLKGYAKGNAYIK